MKKLFIISLSAFLFACKGGKKENKPTDAPAAPPVENTNPANVTAPEASSNSNGIKYTLGETEIRNYASLLVTKDKDNLKAGTPYMCMLTSNAAKNNNEYLTLNFLLDTKPGTYPVVGTSLQRGKSPNDEMYGGMLGGKPKLTSYNVTITECKDLGDNGQGGHKWSISGTCEEVMIKAMPIMLMDKEKKHPEEIKVSKISFSNLNFDDNWENMMEKAMEKMKK
jgi:hypothetical protein